MRIEITFHADPDDQSEYAKLDGYQVTMEGVDQLNTTTAVDTFDGPDGKLPGETGSIILNAHGKRAMWHVPAPQAEGEPDGT